MSIATQISALQTDKNNIANAITTKGGTVSSGDGFDNFASDILTIPTGGGGQTQTKSLSVTQNGSYTVLPDTGYTLSEVDVSVSVPGGVSGPPAVRFIDYDGTVISELTQSELNELTELPNLPYHEQDDIPMTGMDWNWELLDIKEFRTNNPGYTVNVGAHYTTSDFCYHLIYDVPGGESNSQYHGAWKATLYLTGTVDWGDGTVETINNAYIDHWYESGSKYDCVVDVTSGILKIGGASTGVQPYALYLTEIRLPYGKGLDSIQYPVPNLRVVSTPSTLTSFIIDGTNVYNGLEWITMPRFASTFVLGTGEHLKYQPMTFETEFTTYKLNNATRIPELFIPDSITAPVSTQGAFRYDYSVKKIHIGKYFSISTATAMQYMFAEARNLEEVEFAPNSVCVRLSNYMFQNCVSLKKVTLPTGLTTIGTYSFANCRALEEIEIPASVTTIGANAFNGTYTTLIMKGTVPPTIQTTSLSATLNAVIVPWSADHSVVQTYRTSGNWTPFENIISEAAQP